MKAPTVPSPSSTAPTVTAVMVCVVDSAPIPSDPIELHAQEPIPCSGYRALRIPLIFV